MEHMVLNGGGQSLGSFEEPLVGTVGESMEFTKLMAAIFAGEDAPILTTHCRDELRYAYDSYVKNGSIPNSWSDKTLCQICRDMELDPEQIKKNPEEIEKTISFQDMIDEYLDRFYEMYQKAPSSESYMRRIVSRLAPDYKNNTVRLAILKKFLLEGGKSWGEYKATPILKAIRDMLTEEEKEEYNRAFPDSATEADGTEEQQEADLWEPTQLDWLIRHAKDGIFAPERLSPELSDQDLLKLMCETAKDLRENGEMDPRDSKSGQEVVLNDFPLKEDTSELLETVCNTYNLVSPPEQNIFDVMEQLQNILQKNDDCSEICHKMVQALERDFISRLNQISYRKSKGNTEKSPTENARRFYRDRKKTFKESRQEFQMLNLCNDLAGGVFITNHGNTRRNLYYFAFMFGMTVRLDPDQKLDDAGKITDIGINLFENYYNDSMLRFLNRHYHLQNAKSASQYESEPTGDGINFKNFAEIVYLFYLGDKESNISGGEKINLAEKTIRACVTQAKKKKEKGIAIPEHLTADMVTASMQSDVLKKFNALYRDMSDTRSKNPCNAQSEKALQTKIRKELADYISDRYVVLPDESAKALTNIAVSGEQQRASMEIAALMDQIDHKEMYLVFNDIDQGGTMQLPVIQKHIADLFFSRSKPANDPEYADEYGSNPDYSRQHFETAYNLLMTRFAGDSDFCATLDRMKNLIPEQTNWIGSDRQRVLLEMLYVLIGYRSEPVSVKKLQNHILNLENQYLHNIISSTKNTFKNTSEKSLRHLADCMNQMKIDVRAQSSEQSQFRMKRIAANSERARQLQEQIRNTDDPAERCALLEELARDTHVQVPRRYLLPLTRMLSECEPQNTQDPEASREEKASCKDIQNVICDRDSDTPDETVVRQMLELLSQLGFPIVFKPDGSVQFRLTVEQEMPMDVIRPLRYGFDRELAQDAMDYLCSEKNCSDVHQENLVTFLDCLLKCQTATGISQKNLLRELNLYPGAHVNEEELPFMVETLTRLGFRFKKDGQDGKYYLLTGKAQYRDDAMVLTLIDSLTYGFEMENSFAAMKLLMEKHGLNQDQERIYDLLVLTDLLMKFASNSGMTVDRILKKLTNCRTFAADSRWTPLLTRKLSMLGFTFEYATKDEAFYVLDQATLEKTGEEDPDLKKLLDEILHCVGTSDFNNSDQKPIFKKYPVIENLMKNLTKTYLQRPGKVSRTTLILYSAVAFCEGIFGSYNGLTEDVNDSVPEDDDTYTFENIRDLYNHFSFYVDPCLGRCRFQPFNTKNIFDMYILLALFLYFFRY